MTDVIFNGAGLSSDLAPYLKHLESSDASMAKIFKANLALLEAAASEENRKTIRPIFNGLIKDALNRPETPAPEEVEEMASGTPGVLPSTVPASTTRFFLSQLSVEGFRGIRNEGAPLVLKFAPDSVNSVFAQNGTGKSSVYEALQYAIQGSVPRLANMQANENSDGYLANLFHSAGEATIKLTLSSDDGTPNVEVEVKRTALGQRKVTSPTNHPDPEGLLKSLSQDFTLLDYSTFTRFIEDTALNRGRSFSSLLGLSDYANFRRMLKTVENTQTFRNDFAVPELEARKRQHQQGVQSSLDRFSRSYTEVTGREITDVSKAQEWGADIVNSLRGVPLLRQTLACKELAEVDFTLLREEVLKAEGGPERKHLETLIDQRALLADVESQGSVEQDCQALFTALEAHEALISTTQGEHMHRLNAAADYFLRTEATWDTHVCPLCNSSLEDPIDQTVEASLASFRTVAEGTEALREKVLGSIFLKRLALLEGLPLLGVEGDQKQAAPFRAAAIAGTLTQEILKEAQDRLSVLETRLVSKTSEVNRSIADLEQKIPPSLVSLTAQISAAHSAQRALDDYFAATKELDLATATLSRYERWKAFIGQAHSIFSSAESELSNRTLLRLRAEYQQMFAEVMSAGDIVPELTRPGTDEHMTVELARFHGKQNVSARALLSESYRNALAISVFLSAAASHTKTPRFIVLDDATSSFDSGHQYHLMEQIRTRFQYPARPDGLQFIMFSHDVALEKYFDRLDAEPGWNHQKLQGWPPLTPVTTHGQNPDRLRSEAERFLLAGQLQEGSGLIRQYLEFVLQQIIKKVQVPVPLDLAVNDHQKMVSSCIDAIVYAVKIHEAANQIILTPEQIADLRTHHAPSIVANWVSHYGTSGASSFSPAALLGVLNAIDAMRRCFQYDTNGNGDWRFYRSLTKR
ncbi:AAA family ATPase [Arthrobacter sp. NPDC080073]|uniref:ATP-binding protein n=1 Tax=Arthrobacter sp. NPDC080073 TaxID=3155919 RepID=UPI003418044A